tara:strand:- start:808 stop:2184 length:1377 start_codon:yes stop_codon:yes gene_type:complete
MGKTNKGYAQFIENKSQFGPLHGFDDIEFPEFLFDFQKTLVEWSIRKGRSAIFADCGLGKTPMQLAWAEAIQKKTNKPVLILTPLAVSHQTVAEGEKFGIEVKRSTNGIHDKGITVTNYERLHYFNPDDFSGVVCDESSILKSFDGVRKESITDFMRKVPYRLLCTATAAPNDYIELGTSSEALGELGYIDMLNQFFINDQGTTNPNKIWDGAGWRFKHHGEQHFWRWVSSWARAIRKPSDLGFSDDSFDLPPLNVDQSVIPALMVKPGMLFDVPAVGLQEEREVRRRTINERCELAASKVKDTNEPAVMWCHLNDEGDLLENLVPGSVQVSGSDSDDEKESKFQSFQNGDIRVLITKPKIGAFGLNWQHCAHLTYFPSHSYEQYYQAVRRCWRFGQDKPVTVDLVSTDGDERVVANLQRKTEAADVMFADLVRHMGNELTVQRSREYPGEVEIPSWL